MPPVHAPRDQARMRRLVVRSALNDQFMLGLHTVRELLYAEPLKPVGVLNLGNT